MSDKILTLAPPAPKDISELRVAIRPISENWADKLEFAEWVARYRRMQYDAHIKAGFTEDQALELCK